MISDTFDEGAAKVILGELKPDERALFACACAEQLLPLYDWFTTLTGRGSKAVLREALNVAWDTSEQVAATNEAGWIPRVMDLIPDDEDDWSDLNPLAQNAAAAVAYALRTRATGESQEAVWAARQVIDAADYLLQLRGSRDSQVGDGAPSHVAIALATTLASLKTSSATELRAQASSAGDMLLGMAKASRPRASDSH